MSGPSRRDRARARLRKVTSDGQRAVLPALGRELFGMVMRRRGARRGAAFLFGGRVVRPHRMVFLCGCYNSGTTVMRDMLGSHPRIRSLPREGVIYTERLTAYTDGRWTRFWPPPEEIRAANERDFATLKADDLLRDWSWWIDANAVFVEKSITNSARMTHLQTLFPDAVFIVMRRDATGVAEGIVRRTRPLDARAASKRPSLENALSQWTLCNALIDEQLPRLRHVIEVIYESLTADPAAELRRVFAAIGVDARIDSIEGGVRLEGIDFPIFDGNARSRRNLERTGD